jgi:hypothetical protein
LKFQFQWDKLDDFNNIKPKHFIHKGRWNKVSRKKTMKPKTLVPRTSKLYLNTYKKT